MINANLIRPVRHAIVVACVALLTLGALPAGAQASPKSSDGHFAPYPADEVAPLAESGNITAGSCTYRQAIDDPHVTSGDASVHG